jgi:hypothetical protein
MGRELLQIVARPRLIEVQEETMPESSHEVAAEYQDMPSDLRVPDGNSLLLQAFGKGVQIYTCPAGATTAPRPHAILLEGHRQEGDLVAIHYAGPTWEATDGSKVVGERVASAPAPDPDGVDWLLLKAKSHEGDGKFNQITYIQRLYTDGGKPPEGGCKQGQAEILVEYSAQYLFYAAATE